MAIVGTWRGHQWRSDDDRVTNGGFTWGYMNGMRPRGMLLFEGKLEKGVLTGAMRFGGIHVIRPPGWPEPPTLRFELRKMNDSKH
jgi:hypothetical protein